MGLGVASALHVLTEFKALGGRGPGEAGLWVQTVVVSETKGHLLCSLL